MILKAIRRAYQVLEERKYDTIYWAIDIHGTCLKSNYKNSGYEFINEEARIALGCISSLPESVVILWSGCHQEQKDDITEFFKFYGIKVDYFNENPLEASNATGNFEEKFYFSVLLDDKAGFDPYTDWQLIIDYFQSEEYLNNVRVRL